MVHHSTREGEAALAPSFGQHFNRFVLPSMSALASFHPRSHRIPARFYHFSSRTRGLTLLPPCLWSRPGIQSCCLERMHRELTSQRDGSLPAQISPTERSDYIETGSSLRHWRSDCSPIDGHCAEQARDGSHQELQDPAMFAIRLCGKVASEKAFLSAFHTVSRNGITFISAAAHAQTTLITHFAKRNSTCIPASIYKLISKQNHKRILQWPYI